MSTSAFGTATLPAFLVTTDPRNRAAYSVVGDVGLRSADGTNTRLAKSLVSSVFEVAFTSAGGQAHMGAAVTVASRADAVAELRRITSLTWAELAELFHVDAPTVLAWVSGRAPSAQSGERIDAVHRAVKGAARGAPTDVREWLFAPLSSGGTRFGALVNGHLALAPMTSGDSAEVKRPGPLPIERQRERLPLPPATLAGALQDRVHIDRSRLIKATPLTLKPKR